MSAAKSDISKFAKTFTESERSQLYRGIQAAGVDF
jgi:hypothetical protein